MKQLAHTSTKIDLYKNEINRIELPKRRALSSRYPVLKEYIIFLRIAAKKLHNQVRHKIARKRHTTFFNHVVARHQSVLLRKLGNSDLNLQVNKITNLKLACESLNGLIIKPGEVFSLWETIGLPSYKKGYVDGMLLSNGKIIKGVGGGLCQLSNFLCWLFIHADTKIIERYHHSFDVFPDSGRTLPFGSGATCLYNFVDLKIKNTGHNTLQLKIWVNEKHLKGQLLSSAQCKEKFSIRESDHFIIKSNNRYYRTNTLWRIKKINGQPIDKEKIFFNFAPILYKVDKDYIKQNKFTVLKI